MAAGTYLAWGPTSWSTTHTVFDWFSAYNGIIAVILNIAVAAAISFLFPTGEPDATDLAGAAGASSR